MGEPGDFEKIIRELLNYEAKNKSDEETLSFKCFRSRYPFCFQILNYAEIPQLSSIFICLPILKLIIILVAL